MISNLQYKDFYIVHDYVVANLFKRSSLSELGSNSLMLILYGEDILNGECLVCFAIGTSCNVLFYPLTDYVGFIKKVMKLLQTSPRYMQIKKVDVDLVQLEESEAVPPSPGKLLISFVRRRVIIFKVMVHTHLNETRILRLPVWKNWVQQFLPRTSNRKRNIPSAQI